MAGSKVAFQKPLMRHELSVKTLFSPVVAEPKTAPSAESSKIRSPWTEEQKKILLGAMSASSTENIRWLSLDYGSSLDGCLFRLQKSWKLRFVVCETLFNVNVRIFVNHPPNSGSPKAYRELMYSEKPAISGLLFADVEMLVAGSFQYFFTVDGSNREDRARGHGRFIVDPDLRVGKALRRIPLDGIACQTVLSKNLGPFTTWMSRLLVAKKSGYNAIHFTPVQELGASGSAYALRDLFRINPSFGPGVSMSDIEKLVKRLYEEYEILSFTDLVLNHAANESEWLASRPNCVYNLFNSPHLRPAFLVDCALVRFSAEIERGEWVRAGIPNEITSEAHLDAISRVLHENLMPGLRLWEFYQLDAEDTIRKIRLWVESNGTLDVSSPLGQLNIMFDTKSEFARYEASVDMNLAARLYGRFGDVAYDDLRQKLHQLNHESCCVTRDHINVAVSNVIAHVRHRFVDPSGLLLGRVTSKEPLVDRYFRTPVNYVGKTMADDEVLMYSEEAKFCWVHSGWVDANNFDPLRNFADLGSDVYIRRELNPWTDSVKLRYGSSRSECPELWDHVLEYAKTTARVFHGIRLDNCHSTSSAVAEHVVDGARSVRPDLFVFAELYAGSGPMTTTRASHLGINAVIQSALELSSPRQLAEKLTMTGGRPLGAFVVRSVDPLVPCPLPVIFFDQTHDDPSPLELRSIFDVLPTSALIAASTSAVGSNRGYDEVIPQRISVVTETRLYRPWILPEATQEAMTSGSPPVSARNAAPEHVDYDTGIVRAKKALNELHLKLANNGYDQSGMEVIEDDVIAMTRYSAKLRRACVIIAHSAFRQQTDDAVRPIRNLELPGIVRRVILEGSVTCRMQAPSVHPKLITGVRKYSVYLQEDIHRVDSSIVRVIPSAVAADLETVEFKNFRPGCVVALDVKLTPDADAAVGKLEQLVTFFDRLIWNIPLHVRDIGASSEAIVDQLRTVITDAVIKDIFAEKTHTDNAKRISPMMSSSYSTPETRSFDLLLEAVCALSKADAHYVLYESSELENVAAYHLPEYGDLGHCGLASLVPIFDDIHFSGTDPRSHPLGRNLCDGDWLMDYMSGRLMANPSTRMLGEWFVDTFEVVKKLPRFLVSRYFETVVSGVFSLVSMQVQQ